MIGRGHGSTYLKLLAERLRTEGAPIVCHRSRREQHPRRRAYEKAGFRGDAVVENDNGPAILMIFDGQSRDSTAQ